MASDSESRSEVDGVNYRTAARRLDAIDDKIAALQGGVVGVPALSADEEQWWQYAAAMLDPSALDLVKASAGSVPAGETWLAFHAWRVKFAGATHYQYVRQVFPGANPLVLPAGTAYDATYNSGPGVDGCLTFYRVDAALLASNDGYTSDPKGLYYERVAEANAGPVQAVTVSINDNSTQTAAIPVTGGYYVTSSSFQDCAWMGFYDGVQTSLTLLPERSDSDPFRFASPHLLALHVDVYPSFSARGANSGDASAGCTFVEVSA